MAPSIHDRVSHAEQDFLLAASRGFPALEAFQDMWSILLQDIQRVSQAQLIDDDTSALWHKVASRIAILSDCLVDVETNAQTLTSTFYGDLEAIFARIDIADSNNSTVMSEPQPLQEYTKTSDSHSLSLSISNDTSGTSIDNYIHPYIDYAHTWLLKNLHNPYPPKEIRNSISSQTGSARATIDAWFIDARKRIGWNSLRRKHFSNKRIEIVQAATRFFLNQTLKREPYSFINVDSEFASIEMKAKNLYLGKRRESVLASQLDVAIRDMSPKTKLQAKVLEDQRKREEWEARIHTEQQAKATLPYPSIYHLPRLSPEPLLPSDDPDPSAVPPVSVTSHKRTISARDSPEHNTEHPTPRPNKRSRFNAVSNTYNAVEPFPSPVLSSNESPSPMGNNTFAPPPISSTVIIPSLASRKRRLSDAKFPNDPKRPKNVSGPRLHAVSDPLPPSSALSNWFEIHLGLCPVTTGEPDLNVEFYDYSEPGNVSTAQSLTPYVGPTIDSDVYFDLPFPKPCPMPDDSINVIDHNELFRELEHTLGRFTQNDIEGSSEFLPSTSDYSISEIEFASNSLHTVSSAQDTVIIADPAGMLSQNAEPNFDWMFPPLVHSEETYNYIQEYGFAQSGNKSEPLGMGSNAVGSDKIMKQKKLMEMREATRRLEAEIASSES